MKCLFVLTAALATVAFGQGSGGSTSGTNTNTSPYAQLQTYLGLSNAQLTQLTQLQSSYLQNVQSLGTQINAKQAALTSLTSSGSPDAGTVGTLYLSIVALQNQITAAGTQYEASAAAVLTSDEQTQLATLKNAMSLQVTINEAVSLGLLNGAFMGTSSNGVITPLSVTINGIQIQPYPASGGGLIPVCTAGISTANQPCAPPPSAPNQSVSGTSNLSPIPGSVPGSTGH
jgi:hypothetical protein